MRLDFVTGCIGVICLALLISRCHGLGRWFLFTVAFGMGMVVRCSNGQRRARNSGKGRFEEIWTAMPERGLNFLNLDGESWSCGSVPFGAGTEWILTI